jgi:prepilin-type N-terminal cleavage/methylation domain-containing protein
MGRRTTRVSRVAGGHCAAGGFLAVRESGFTLVEMVTSVSLLLVVLTAAWMLLTVSNDNLNHIDYGGQASEINRAALDSFERDLNHSVLPSLGVSAITRAAQRTCTFLADVDKDGTAELVTWSADDENHRLLRSVTQAPEGNLEPKLTDFATLDPTTETVLTGLAEAGSTAPAATRGTATSGPWDS